MKAHIVTYGQTLIDVAIQRYGAYGGVLLLLEDNPLVERIESPLQPGTTLLYRDAVPVLTNRNRDFARQFELNKTVVNCGRKVLPDEGLGYYVDGYIEEGYFETV